MKCKWTLCVTLTTALAGSLATPALGQYQYYPTTSASSAPAMEYGPSPRKASLLPPITQTAPASSADQTVPAPRGYSPSEMPSVSPFANMQSRHQQTPVTYGGTPFQTTGVYHQAPQSYYTYANATGPTALGDLPQPAVGGGLPYAPPAHSSPAEQMTPVPQAQSHYDQPTQEYWSQPAYGLDVKGAGCATGLASGCHSGWYGGVYGLVMTRSRANNVWLSYDQTDIRDRVLNSNDANFATAGGAGVNLGHYFNCGQNAIQFTYWGLYPGTSEANAYGANTAVGIDTILHFDGLQYDAGAGAQPLSGTFFFNAEHHRVQRSYDVQNFELNLLGYNFSSACCPLQLGWVAGVRYLRFNEDFLYSSDPNDPVFTGAPEEVHYAINANNNLVGIQLGGQANYCVGPRLGLFANTKVGLYGNHMSQTSQIYGSNGGAFVGDAASPYFGQDVFGTASRNGYSMIGDLSLGANWCINPCWSINFGYRAIGITGVALSTNQIPGDFIGALDSIRTVNPNGCLLLHGAFAGVNFCY